MESIFWKNQDKITLCVVQNLDRRATIDSFGYPDCPGHPVWLEPAEWLGGDSRRYRLQLVATGPDFHPHAREIASFAVRAQEPIMSFHPHSSRSTSSPRAGRD